uniref:Uncharacterized protein n=1 Tax=viral metagenome TaxID=1070528 RepID=A0A6C0JF27_9ZZZZ
MKNLIFLVTILYIISSCSAQQVTKICETNYYDTNLESYPTIRYDQDRNMYAAGLKLDGSGFVILKYDQNCNELWFKQYNRPYGINIYHGNNPIPRLDNMTIATVRKQNRREQELIFIPIPNVVIMRGSTRFYRSHILILDTETGNKEWCGLVETDISGVTYIYETVSSVFIDTSGALTVSMVVRRNYGITRGNTLIKYSSHIPIRSNKLWDLSFQTWDYSHSVIIDIIERQNVIYVSTYFKQVKKINSITGEILWSQTLQNVNLGKLFVDSTEHVWVTGTSSMSVYTTAALFGDCVSCTSYLVKLNKQNGRIIKGISYENCDSRFTTGIPTTWSALCSRGRPGRYGQEHEPLYRYLQAFDFTPHPSIPNQALVVVPFYSGYTLHIVLDLDLGIISDKYFIGGVLGNVYDIKYRYIVFNNGNYSEIRKSNSGINLKSYSFTSGEIPTTIPPTTVIRDTRIATSTQTATTTATHIATVIETSTQTDMRTLAPLVTAPQLTPSPVSNDIVQETPQDTSSSITEDYVNSFNNVDNSQNNNIDNSNNVVNNVSIDIGLTVGLSVTIGVIVLCLSVYYVLRRRRRMNNQSVEIEPPQFNLNPTAPPPAFNPEYSFA